MTKLWRVDKSSLISVGDGKLDEEKDLEQWIENDPAILDADLLIIGRQVETGFGRIDLLGIRSDGSLLIIELKRDKTPRDVIAQILEYASWAAKRNTADVLSVADQYSLQKKFPSFAERFSQYFQTGLPEVLNPTHGMLVVASTLDQRSKKIVEYLSEEHGISINTAFFNVFTDGDRKYLAADWLLDQQEVAERTAERVKAPWKGDWYANVDDGSSRSWEDMRKYGFLAAGGGRFYSGRLDQLTKDDLVYVYQRGQGYVGRGVVQGESMLAGEFRFEGKSLFDLPLEQPNLAHDSKNPELAEYLVPVKWMKTVPISHAKKFPGAFANQNIVCRLRDPATLEFLEKEF